MERRGDERVEVEAREEKAIIGSDESPKYFWKPQLELH